MMSPTLKFREVTPSPLARFESGVCVVRGRMHIIGGHYGEELDVTDEHWAYDLASDQWDRFADQPEPVSHYTCKVQDDRYAWYTGGYLGKHPGTAVNKTWRYDAETDTWDEFAPLPVLRASLGCAIIENKMHVWGGLGEDRNTNFDDHWVPGLANPDEWKPAAPMPDGRAHFATGVVGAKPTLSAATSTTTRPTRPRARAAPTSITFTVTTPRPTAGSVFRTYLSADPTSRRRPRRTAAD
ncbi:MAG: kelch repeat-containing protein [Planctomycetota bacterium]